MRTRRLWAVLAVLALVVVACGDENGEATNGEAANGEEADGPSFIYITPNPIGGNEFLEMGETGTESAAERLNGTAQVYESTDPSSMRANLEAAVDEAPDIIVLTTFQLTDLGQEFATDNPDQMFILIDDCPEEPAENLFCVGFREHEGAYLLGIMAGNLTESGDIGSILAVDIPFFHRWSNSFYLGAESVNADLAPDTQVTIGGDNPFNDPARAMEQALALSAQGLDHIFSVGAGSDIGVFEAAEEEGFFTYGTDINNCPVAPDVIVDNNLKLVDVAVDTAIDLVLAGEAEPFTSLGLAEGGVGVMAIDEDGLADSECLIADHPDIVDQVREAAQAIIDGEIVVPDPLMG